MHTVNTERGVRAGGGAAIGAAAAVTTGATPIGIVVVAGMAAALGWWSCGRQRAGPR